MKKFLLAMMVALVLLVSCSSTDTITFSDGEEIIEKFENKESFVFVISSSTCSACAQYRPIVEEAIESKGLDVFYIESDKVNNEQLVELVENYLDNDLEWTPTTYFVVDGEVKESLAGALRYSLLVEKLEEYQLIS